MPLDVEVIIRLPLVHRQLGSLCRTEAGQRLQVRFLDVSLRERGSSGGSVSPVSPFGHQDCTSDSVSVSERGKTLMRMCGELGEDITLLSEGNSLEVRQKSIR